MAEKPRWVVSLFDVSKADRAVSVRQVVAYNLALGRRQRGMTQDVLGARLQELTGKPWSRATVSAAESGWKATPGRVRHFDVNEVVAFALALKLPISWFFLPPREDPDGEPVEDDTPWIEVSTAERKPSLAMSAEQLRWLSLARGDAEDPDEVMTRRVGKDDRASGRGRKDDSTSGRPSRDWLLEHLYNLYLQAEAEFGEPESRPWPNASSESRPWPNPSSESR